MTRIARLETFNDEFVCFVRATAEDGAFGWGQTSACNADMTAQVFHRQGVPRALGAGSADVTGLQRDVLQGQPFTVTDGSVTVTDTPGWGPETSPAWLDRATYTEAAIESFRPSAYGAFHHKGGRA